MNDSEGLTLRDYKNAEVMCAKLLINCSLIQPGQFLENLCEGISFSSFANYMAAKGQSPGARIDKVLLILDEFDSILFNSLNDTDKIHQGLRLVPLLIGFSGSDLKDYHLRAAERLTDGNLVQLRIKNGSTHSVVNHGAEVIAKIMDFREVVSTVCLQQAAKTPLVIIADDDKDILLKKLQRSGLVAEALHKQSIV
jgi:hypothetical protein